MTDEELQEALLVAVGQLVDVSGGQVVISEPEPVADEVPPTGEDTDPDMPPLPDDSGGSSADEQLVAIMAQAELAMLDIRSSVGRRVMAALAGGKCTECVEAVSGVPAARVVVELGEQVITDNELDLRRFAEGAGDTFGLALEARGATYAQSRALQEVLELHAVASIYDLTPGLPTGFAGHVRTLTR